MILTGASGGLGHALAIELAAPGVAMFLAGRDAGRLQQTALAAQKKGASVTTWIGNLPGSAAFLEATQSFDKAHPVDLVIVNAGVKVGNVKGIEPIDQTRRVF